MPVVDGVTSTKMVRQFESVHPNITTTAKAHGRVPIFAVSASLVEQKMDSYIDTGFDGWIMKPIDFKRLNLILSGIQQESSRIETTYQPNAWEKGGWFVRQDPLKNPSPC